MTTMNTPVMDALVDFVLGLELAAVPPSVVDAANRSMTCGVTPLTLQAADQREPKTPLEAKFSVRFCAAMALVRGDAGEAEFTEASLADPAVAKVMARVMPEGDDSLTIPAAHMTVRFADGRVIEAPRAGRRATRAPATTSRRSSVGSPKRCCRRRA